MNKLTAFLAFLAVAGLTIPAHTATLNFEFTILSPDGPSSDIHGILIGLEEDADSLPSDIFITSAPSDFGLGNYVMNSSSNTGFFTVSGGNIISITNVSIGTEPITPNPSEYVFDFNFEQGDGSFLNAAIYQDSFGVANFDGPSGTSFAQTEEVPEPSTYVLLGLGVVLLLSARRLKLC